MKFAYVMTDGLEQFVLTPETDTEKKLVAVLTQSNDRELSIYRGGFYECKGGWFRARRRYPSLYSCGDETNEDDSAIICLRPKVDEPISDEMPE